MLLILNKEANVKILHSKYNATVEDKKWLIEFPAKMMASDPPIAIHSYLELF